MSKLEGGGRIKLEFLAKGDLIEVRIEDNGVGFDIENPSTSDSGSKGIRLIKERLDLLESSNKSLDFEIQSKVGAGTIVKLQFSDKLR